MSSRQPRSGRGGAYSSRRSHFDDRGYAGESQSYSRGGHGSRPGAGRGRGKYTYNSRGPPRESVNSSDSTRAYPRAGSHSSDRGYGESRSNSESQNYGGGRGRGRGGWQSGGAPRGHGQRDPSDNSLRSGDSESRNHSGGHGRGRGRGHSARGRNDAWREPAGFGDRESRSYSRGRGRGGRQSGGEASKGHRPDRQVCLFYKFTGNCEYGDGCRNRHLRPIAKDKRLECYVPIPESLPVPVALGRKWCNPQLVMDTVECAVIPSKRNDQELKIVTDSKENLQDAREVLEILLVQLIPIITMRQYCYQHMEGAREISESMLFFEPYSSQGFSSKAMVYQVSISDCKASKGSSLLKLETSCSISPSEPKPDVSHSTPSENYGATSQNPDKVLQSIPARVRTIPNHMEDIQLELSNALKWLAKEHIPTRGQGCNVILEARFGKVVWKHVPDDFLASDRITVENFTELIVEKLEHRTFSTIVLKKNVDTQLIPMLDCNGIAVETFDFRLTAINEVGDKTCMDARLRILESGEKAVLQVKKDEKKIILLDIICLHRKHDIRIGLNCVNIVPQDLSHQLYQIAKQMLDTVQYSQDQILTFVPHSSTWAVSFIRHKIRTPYVIDDKYIVTVSSIKEHAVKWMNAKKGELQSIELKDFKKEHLEVELHNARWVTAFGRSAGLSPEESLERMLHMNHSDITPELAAHTPHPWTVESIAEDFEEFLGHSESLNETLGEVAIATEGRYIQF